jgi:hypothetical protein
MNQLMIFNHLSLPYESRVDADAAVLQFIRICLRANVLGLSVILFGEDVDTTWFRIELAHGYYFRDWFNRNNRDENRDILRAFRSIQTRQPFFPSEIDVALFDVVLSDYERVSLSTLRAAVWYEAPLISFPVKLPWNSSPIRAVIQVLNNEGDLGSQETEVINIYSLSVLQELEPVLLKQQQASLIKGRDIVDNMGNAFPGVVLCGKAKEQLLSEVYPSLVFEQIRESFSAFSCFTQDWQTGQIKQYSHNALQNYGLVCEVSGESSSVGSNPNLRKLREFWLPSGRKVYFENHVKYNLGKYRLHFFPDPIDRIIYVGYIGRHLPT